MAGKLPKDLIKILQTPNIVKVGVDLNNDIVSLNEYGITLRGSFDIQSIARTMIIQDLSLEALAGRFVIGFTGKDPFNETWDWDHELSVQQIQYAARDAYFSLWIYGGMLKGVNIVTPIPPENSQEEEKNYLQWLKSNVQSTDPRKIINQTINSYGPWRKRYTLGQRIQLAEKLLQKFIKEGRF